MVAVSSAPLLKVGFILMPDFTMLALAGFIDTLRLAADEGDRSRQIDCAWTVMSSDGALVQASNGITIVPDSPFVDPASFDYLVVAGGVMHRLPELDDALKRYLSSAADLHVPLVGICTGGFVLARAGLMQGRKCCVSWFHRAELEIEFPDLQVVADQLFVSDRGRITCAGGTSVIHLASHLIERHLGQGRSSKGLRVMLEDRLREASSPQPLPTLPGLEQASDARVRRAMLKMERTLMSRQSVADLAQDVGSSARHLNRLFKAAIGMSPATFKEALRMARARELVTQTDMSLTTLAFRLGFADVSHFSRCFRKHFGRAPSEARQLRNALRADEYPPQTKQHLRQRRGTQ